MLIYICTVVSPGIQCHLCSQFTMKTCAQGTPIAKPGEKHNLIVSVKRDVSTKLKKINNMQPKTLETATSIKLNNIPSQTWMEDWVRFSDFI